MNKHLATLLAAATLVAPLAARASDRDVVKAFYSRLLSATAEPDLPERIAETLSPDWRSIGDYASPVKTRDQFLTQLKRTGSVAPSLTWTIEEMLQVGNRFIVRGRARATPTGSFMGAASTGRSFDIMAIDIHTVEDNRITLSYHVEDWNGAVEQLQQK